MPRIFISYRRDDRPGFAGRLVEALEKAFGASKVFRDIEDIRPGEDFVAAIDQRLREVDVMLVMIGPNWLDASKEGRRRLDDADDFVRLEIRSVLQSGKTVLPVLVSGATMPAEAALPEDLRPLARRQAVVLSEVGWRDDVARLITALRPMLSSRASSWRRPRHWALAAATLALLGGLLVALWPDAPPPPVDTAHPGMTPPQADPPRATPSDLETPAQALESPAPRVVEHPARRAPPTPAAAAQAASSAPAAADFTGLWRASVPYDWGAQHEERFDLRPEDGELFGTASYLRVPRVIEQGEWRGERIRFVTRTQVVQGGEAARELTHRYRGRLDAGAIHFVLETSGGYSSYAPVEFVARRVEE